MSGKEAMSGKAILGVEWLGACFDILYTDLLDLGNSNKSGRKVFNIARNPDGTAEYETYRDGAYSVPIGVKLAHAASLDVVTTKDVMYNSYDFRAKVASTFGISGGLGNAFEFSGSTSVANASERTQSQKQVLKYSTMVRKYNHVTLDVDAPSDSAAIKQLRQLLDPDFVNAVGRLPPGRPVVASAGPESPFSRFISQYGTHFASKLELGGMAYEQVRVQEDVISSGQVNEQKLDA
jgi:hypothetical protein